jgi:hypothetical protein
VIAIARKYVLDLVEKRIPGSYDFNLSSDNQFAGSQLPAGLKPEAILAARSTLQKSLMPAWFA